MKSEYSIIGLFTTNQCFHIFELTYLISPSIWRAVTTDLKYIGLDRPIYLIRIIAH